MFFEATHVLPRVSRETKRNACCGDPHFLNSQVVLLSKVGCLVSTGPGESQSHVLKTDSGIEG